MFIINDIFKLKEIKKYSVKIKFSPDKCNTIKSIIDHEIGHIIDSKHTIRDRYAILKLRDFAVKNGIKNSVSEYRNNPKPRKYAKGVGKIMGKFLKSEDIK